MFSTNLILFIFSQKAAQALAFMCFTELTLLASTSFRDLMALSVSSSVHAYVRAHT